MIEQDFFTLFQLPRQYAIDQAALDAAWKRVSLQVHPDRFATASPSEKRVAMQWSSHANEGYRVLRDPLARARYLCELAGVDLQTETNTAMSPGFLMQQMEWREQLDEIEERSDSAALQSLASRLKTSMADVQQDVATLLDTEQYDQAATRLRECMFIDKFFRQVQSQQGLASHTPT